MTTEREMFRVMRVLYGVSIRELGGQYRVRLLEQSVASAYYTTIVSENAVCFVCSYCTWILRVCVSVSDGTYCLPDCVYGRTVPLLKSASDSTPQNGAVRVTPEAVRYSYLASAARSKLRPQEYIGACIVESHTLGNIVLCAIKWITFSGDLPEQVSTLTIANCLLGSQTRRGQKSWWKTEAVFPKNSTMILSATMWRNSKQKRKDYEVR